MTRTPDAPGPAPGLDAESFVRTYQTGIWRYLRLLGASTADADELLQETFLAFLQKAEPQPESVPLLRTIARGLWIDRQRWLGRRRAVERAEELDGALAVAPADAHLELWLDALAVCRETLSERPRRALEMVYRDGLGRQEAARELGPAPNTVRNLLARTREVLRQCIEQRTGASEGDQR